MSRDTTHIGREPSFRISTGQLGMIVLFVSLSVVFLASLVAYVITRRTNELWAPPDAGLPLGLIGSTALIAGTSVAMQYALGCTRNNRISVASRALQVAAVLAVGFLTLQTWNWMEVRSTLPSLPVPTLYGFTFYVLTGLHAVHVLGGLVPLGLVMNRTVQGQYSSSRSDGMAFCVQYWHFLGVVWLVLLAALYLVT